MKRWLVFGGAGVIILLVVGLWQGSPATTKPVTRSEQVLGVETLMRNVNQYRSGSVLLEGVVSVADTANRTFALIDTTEFQECDATDCADLMLPVQWSGSMPHTQSLVQVKGKVEERDKKLVFVAQTLKKMGPTSTK